MDLDKINAYSIEQSVFNVDKSIPVRTKAQEKELNSFIIEHYS